MARDRTLVLAGSAAAASVILGSGALTIALIAAARPPVSEYLNAAQNAEVARSVSGYWLMALLDVGLGLWAMLQVVLRRPVPARWAPTRGNLSGPSVAVFSVLFVIVLTLAVRSVLSSLTAINLSRSSAITDASAFSGLTLSLGGLSLMFAVLSSAVFRHWWITGSHEAPSYTPPARTLLGSSHAVSEEN